MNPHLHTALEVGAQDQKVLGAAGGRAVDPHLQRLRAADGAEPGVARRRILVVAIEAQRVSGGAAVDDGRDVEGEAVARRRASVGAR